MSCRSGVSALLLAVAIPAQGVQLPDEPIVFGQPFELVVTAAPGFDAARLTPLVVELLDRSEAGAGSAVRYRYEARCYEVGDVTLAIEPPVSFAVATSLPDPAGELEWPGDGWLVEPEKQSAWWPLWLGAALVAGSGAWFLRRRWNEDAAPEAVPASVPTWDAAAALRELAMPTGDGYEAFYRELKAIVRRHCVARFEVPAEVRTSEELLSVLPDAGDRLQPCLSTCDLALFGGSLFGRQPFVGGLAGGSDSGGQPHRHARDHAIAFVEATAVRSGVSEAAS